MPSGYKLDDSTIRRIWIMESENVPAAKIAERLGISRPTVYKYRRNKVRTAYPHPRYISRREKRKIREDYLAGDSTIEIAQRYGYSKSAILYHTMDLRRQRTPWTAKMLREEVEILEAQGITKRSEQAEIIGISRHRLWFYLGDSGRRTNFDPTTKEVMEIRERHAAGESMTKIASSYGLKHTNSISDVINKRGRFQWF